MVTSWPCVTEAMHVVHGRGGWRAQDALWSLIRSAAVLVMDLDRDSLERLQLLMRKYADVPMDVADATLIVLAEKLHQRTIFTLDSDFAIYRIHDRYPLSLVP
jgi:predicted nucleic acid-binding protein